MRINQINSISLFAIIFSISETNAFQIGGIPKIQNELKTNCKKALNVSNKDQFQVESSSSSISGNVLLNGITASLAAVTLFASSVSLPANAVSGGGLDFAGLDITGQDFSNSNYKGKDFTQTIAKGTNFAKSNLQGCRFYKAFLVNTDFSGADLRGASLEDTSMDGANLKDTNAAGAYFGASILDVASLENADFTDASLPVKVLPLVCDRSDLKGTNPSSGADTRESLMCP